MGNNQGELLALGQLGIVLLENTNILLFVVSGWSQMMKNETNDVFDINILLCFENCYMKPFLLVPGTVELLGFRYKIQLVI